jgi:hypothetical protein
LLLQVVFCAYNFLLSSLFLFLCAYVSFSPMFVNVVCELVDSLRTSRPINQERIRFKRGSCQLLLVLQ